MVSHLVSIMLQQLSNLHFGWQRLTRYDNWLLSLVFIEMKHKLRKPVSLLKLHTALPELEATSSRDMKKQGLQISCRYVYTPSSNLT